jgi:hypothetical protein
MKEQPASDAMRLASYWRAASIPEPSEKPPRLLRSRQSGASRDPQVVRSDPSWAE